MKNRINIYVFIFLLSVISTTICLGQNNTDKQQVVNNQTMVSYDRGVTWQPLIQKKINRIILKTKFQTLESFDQGVTWKNVEENKFNKLIWNTKNGQYVSYDKGVNWELLTKESDYNIKIYPNPAIEYCFVEINGKNTNNKLTIALTDAMGNVINTFETSGSIIKIDTHALASGIYFVKINGDNFNTNKSIVIDR